MKLYFSPGACSLASHIVLHELGLPFEAVRVDLGKKTTAAGADFNQINPKSYVPTLAFGDNDILTEGPVIMQYLADQKPAAGLAPASGTVARYRLQEWLGFINSEIHKAYAPLFYPDSGAGEKAAAIQKLGKRFDFVEPTLARAPYLMGEQFTIADAYLYTVLTWAKPVGIDLDGWPALQAFVARVAARPSVQAAHRAEARAGH